MQSFLATLAMGIALFVFSERMFWGFFRSTDTIPDLLVTLVPYTVGAYIFLWLLERSGSYRIFLIGAIYGWVIEGGIAGTMFGGDGMPMPFSIVWTGLSWHAIVIVLIYKMMHEQRVHRHILYSALIGFFWAAWNVFWRTESPELATSIDVFSAHIVIFTVILLLSMLLLRPTIASFKSSKWGFGASFLVIGVFFFLTVVPLHPLSLLVLPAFLLLTYWRLEKSSEVFHFDQMRPSFSLIFSLPLIPIVGIPAYVVLPTFPSNIVLFFIAVPVGILFYLWSFFKYSPMRGDINNQEIASEEQ